jgi:hypothetical protein
MQFAQLCILLRIEMSIQAAVHANFPPVTYTDLSSVHPVDFGVELLTRLY